MSNILITGAYGFVGTNISQYLVEKGFVLTALDQTRSDLDKNYAAFISWADFDKIDFSQFDTIIHLAGKAHDTKNASEAQVYFDINTKLTQQVFDAFLNSQAKQFIFFSSVKAAADKVEGEYLTEDIVPNPVGPYGESKIRAEEYILQRMKDTDKLVYIFRPCMIHGPGNKGNLNLLYNVVNKGIPYPLGAFDNKRSFLNIWNLAFILENFIMKSPESGIYHLADDMPISTNHLIQLIANSQNKTEKIWKWNQTMVKNIAKCGDWLQLPLNTQRLQKLTENYVVSNQKMKNVLGIKQLPIDVVSGLEQTLKSFK